MKYPVEVLKRMVNELSLQPLMQFDRSLVETMAKQLNAGKKLNNAQADLIARLHRERVVA